MRHKRTALIQGLEFQVEIAYCPGGFDWLEASLVSHRDSVSWYAQRLQGEHGLRSWTGAEAGIGRP